MDTLDRYHRDDEVLDVSTSDTASRNHEKARRAAQEIEDIIVAGWPTEDEIRNGVDTLSMERRRARNLYLVRR